MDKKPSKEKRRHHRRPATALRADPPRKEEGGAERIAKRLARAGVASRREAEAIVAAGRVKLNGKVLSSPAVNVGPGDRIEIDGALLPAAERTRLFLFHKPAGVVTTNRDPEGRRTVFDVLPKDLPRVITVGRLDLNTEGLLLLTNDGGLARVLELPSTGWLRRYRVRVHGKVEPEALENLRQGIAVGGVFYGSIEAALDRVQGSNAWLTIGLREGKNREVRNVLGALGLDVTRLIRVSYGPFQLGDLAQGAVQEIKGRTLRDQLGARLIREAGADFDAPIAKPFANKPAPGRSRDEQGAKEPKPAAQEGGTKRKPDRQKRRDAALERLQTKPGRPRPPKDRERREVPHRRTSNVWMAPGARPVGRKKVEEEAGREQAPAGKGPQRGKPARGGKPAREGKKSTAPASGASHRLPPGGEKGRPASSTKPGSRRGKGKGTTAAPPRGYKVPRKGPKS